MFSLKRPKAGAEEVAPAAPVEQPSRIIPEETGALRAHRERLATEIPGAEKSLEAAKADWQAVVLSEARGNDVGAIETARVRGELANAEAYLEAQQSALSVLDSELAVFDAPERRKAVEAQKTQTRKLAGERARVLDRLEKLVSGELLDLLREYHGLRERMITAFGRNFDWRFSENEDVKFVSRLMVKHLARQLDGQVFDWEARTYSPDPRPWSEREPAHTENWMNELDRYS